jgi:hypothetical protein
MQVASGLMSQSSKMDGSSPAGRRQIYPFFTTSILQVLAEMNSFWPR